MARMAVEPPDLMKKGLRRGGWKFCGGGVEPPDLMKKGLRLPRPRSAHDGRVEPPDLMKKGLRLLRLSTRTPAGLNHQT